MQVTVNGQEVRGPMRYVYAGGIAVAILLVFAAIIGPWLLFIAYLLGLLP